jgi:hypothetical protein
VERQLRHFHLRSGFCNFTFVFICHIFVSFKICSIIFHLGSGCNFSFVFISHSFCFI